MTSIIQYPGEVNYADLWEVEEEGPELCEPVEGWPATPDPALFYGLAGDVVRTIGPHTEADPLAILGHFLAAFGNAAGRNAFYLVESTRHYANLFIALVGATSKARKGTAWQRVRYLFSQVDEEWVVNCVASGLSSGEGLIWRIRDPVLENGEVIDNGVKDKRLLLIEQEFCSTLKVLSREGNTLSPVLRLAWDGEHLAALTKNSPARATDPHVSIVAHITRDELIHRLDQTEQANGFGNRFLWLCVARSKCLPLGGGEPVLAPLITRLRGALAFAKKPRQLTWDEEARQKWCEIYPTLSEGRPGMLGAITARAEAQVVRLALIFALLDESEQITLPHLNAALALWRYSYDSARFIFGDSVGDPVADEILHALKKSPGGVTRTALYKLFGGHKKIAHALSLLVELGLVRREVEKTGGRPTERWLAI